MTYKERKNYLLYVSVAFLVGAVIYGSLALFGINYDPVGFVQQNKFTLFLFSILGGGYLISSVLSGILLFTRFIKNQAQLIKILAIVFFFIRFYIIVLVGCFATIPY